MDTFNAPTEPAMATLHNIAKRQDWHRADIKAALEKAGWTLRKLAVARGYSPGALRNPLSGPWPKGERIIADALGLTPQAIWPSRYNEDGIPNRGRRQVRIDIYKRKSITAIAAFNAHNADLTVGC